MRLLICLFFGFVLVAHKSNAQPGDRKSLDLPKNELKLNLAYGLVGILEINYEYILENDFGIGLAANYSFRDEPNFQYQFIPYFRFYPMVKMRGAGFFVEANAAVMAIVNQDYTDGSGSSQGETSVGGGLGLATGFKFLSRNNYIAEFYIGAGTVFGDYNTELYPRLGITMGKRF